MEVKHSKETGTELILNAGDVARLESRASVRAFNPLTRGQVVVTIKNKVFDNGRELPEHSIPSAESRPDGSLHVDIPVGPEETLDLPITVSRGLGSLTLRQASGSEVD